MIGQYKKSALEVAYVPTDILKLSISGSGSGGMYGANMNGLSTGVKGPFTPSQWMELEHQALIYKYITANYPVPSNLLNPIKKAMESARFSSFSGANLRPLEWGTFSLGFPNNTDPELGRCRRTDGKKWRCSREAVADRKYCDRHTKKSRSRKPVEGQTGHNDSGTTNTTTKFLPMSSSTSAALVVPARGAFDNFGLSGNQLQHGTLNPTTSPDPKRRFLNTGYTYEKVEDMAGLRVKCPDNGLNGRQLLNIKQNPYQESSTMDFGILNSDSLLNPFQKATPVITGKSYRSSSELGKDKYKSDHLLGQFMGNWPKCQSVPLAIPWPDTDTQSDRTRLSIALPAVAADFMSSTSTLTNEKLVCSPIKLSRSLGSAHMGSEMNAIIKNTIQRQANWETSAGGPLGEVLHSSNNSASDSQNSISP
ncbi:Growth-regulating factor [Heracleum sosnowskyi]|uniref:Growth-regulating factor n=1 Tax=Heracleum sosnowskyi TaxID=360622 RepID=A0AAD8J288_9APIA|nr:Growth-regulating factor [Heracleum sosnowskyi]